MRHILGPPLILALMLCACAPFASAAPLDVPDDPAVLAFDAPSTDAIAVPSYDVEPSTIVIEDATGTVLAVVVIEPAKHATDDALREPDRIDLARSLYLTSLDLLRLDDRVRPDDGPSDDSMRARGVIAAPDPHLRC
jgi:hypothetical protein